MLPRSDCSAGLAPTERRVSSISRAFEAQQTIFLSMQNKSFRALLLGSLEASRRTIAVVTKESTRARLRERAGRLIDRFDAPERRRLRAHAIALLFVASAV